MGKLAWLDSDNLAFPDTSNALEDPNGLLAVGGDLSIERLVEAYRRGIFPWYSNTEPILWWSPDPRLVLYPEDIHISQSLRKFARKKPFAITVDTAFEDVLHGCAAPRKGESGTWITPAMHQAYMRLHGLGLAHSVEARGEGGELVGGLYGVCLGKIFFGESMFSAVSGASKIAFVTLCLQLKQWHFLAIDCQAKTEHLISLGAKEISRKHFEALLAKAIVTPVSEYFHQDWQHQWTMPEYGFAL